MNALNKHALGALGALALTKALAALKAL